MESTYSPRKSKFQKRKKSWFDYIVKRNEIKKMFNHAFFHAENKKKVISKKKKKKSIFLARVFMTGFLCLMTILLIFTITNIK